MLRISLPSTDGSLLILSDTANLPGATAVRDAARLLQNLPESARTSLVCALQGINSPAASRSNSLTQLGRSVADAIQNGQLYLFSSGNSVRAKGHGRGYAAISAKSVALPGAVSGSGGFGLGQISAAANLLSGPSAAFSNVAGSIGGFAGPISGAAASLTGSSSLLGSLGSLGADALLQKAGLPSLSTVTGIISTASSGSLPALVESVGKTAISYGLSKAGLPSLSTLYNITDGLSKLPQVISSIGEGDWAGALSNLGLGAPPLNLTLSDDGCWGTGNPMSPLPNYPEPYGGGWGGVLNNVSGDALTLTMDDTSNTLPLGAMSFGGDPVSLASGEEVLRLTDFSQPGLFPLQWQRLYRSGLCDQQSGLGLGWRTAYHQTLELQQDEQGERQLLLTDAEGRVHVFAWVGDGGMSYQQASGMALKHDYDTVLRDMRFHLYLSDGSCWSFRRGNPATQQWQLETVCASDGRTHDCDYDEQHRLSRIRYGHQSAITLEYQGELLTAIHQVRLDAWQEVATQLSTLARYHYSPLGELLSATDQYGRTEHYRYDRGLILQRTRASGFSHYFRWQHYDSRHTAARCIEQWGEGDLYHYHFSYDRLQRITTMTDGRGGIWRHQYNSQWRPVQITSPDGRTERFDYDEHQRLIQHTDGNGHQIRYAYNHRGQREAELHSDGLFHRFRYNDRGQLIQQSDNDGELFKRHFNLAGQPLWLEDACGARSRWVYDRRERLQQWLPAAAPARTFYYDKDQPDRLSSLHIGQARWRFSYDEDGRVNAVLNPDQWISAVRYEQGRVVERRQFAQAQPSQAEVTQYRYNDAGQLLSQTLPDGRTFSLEYDGLAQPVRQVFPDGSSLTLDYDAERNLTSLLRSDGSRYHLDYDGDEHITRTIGFDGREQHYTYDAGGKLAVITEGQRRVELERDSAGRIVRRRCLLEGQGWEEEFLPRLRGGLQATRNPEAEWRFDYRANGQPQRVELRLPEPSGQPERIYALHYQHDEQGLLQGLTLADGSQLLFSYNRDQQLETVRYQRDHDAPPLRLLRRELDAQSREVSRHLGEQDDTLLLLQRFDSRGRLCQQRWQLPHLQRQRDYHFGQDQQLQRIEDSQGGLQQFQYDALGQLSQHHHDLPGHPDSAFCQQGFHFDSLGNPLHHNSEATFDRLTRFGSLRYRYDAYGNQISVAQADGEQPLQQRRFDALNQLREVKEKHVTARYGYDSFGRRIVKRVETRQLIREEGYDADDDNGWVSKIERQSTVFLWEGDRLLGEVSEGRYRWYLYEPDSFRPLLLIDDGQVYYYQLDHLGTPLSLTDSFGHVVWQASYSAFGEAQISIEQVRNPLRFQGQYFDDESGLHYNRHRYYDPHTGRYISQDPIGLLGGLNPYRYAPNPVNWVDPLGLTCKEEGFLARNQQDMQSYWDSIQDGALDSQSPATYMGAGLMKSLGNIGYSIANSVTEAFTSPGEGLKGVAKSVVNFGPELFNGAVNVTKKAADGFTLIAEQSGMFDQGAFQTFRDTEPYNIDLLAPYTNEAQQGGSLIAGVAGGAAATKLGSKAVTLSGTLEKSTVRTSSIKELPAGVYPDERGVYGYLPKPSSRYDNPLYDFTDVTFVERNRKIRLDYVSGSQELEQAIARMKVQGASSEQIARRVVLQRNTQKIEARSLMTDEEVKVLESGNIKRYGDPIGPTPDDLFDKYGDWDTVIEKSMQKDPEINILLGVNPDH
ncbi:hypothetical protein WH50_14030 [Pokkaliibacter plantistimulans]|uniref:Type IV secretion protein Rhs n=1 Tax=Pokkaliibacter plantistimulans TaxID=1635171 RepID=A0ABX5LWX9_9GAMM|nr:RHS repeat-associated core domain-containing protein [Pokkaliibacter plantistimulans]PXF30707.1 hypothetical protein WH50_14030 [Pokkaliibacter plantistimulans]